LGKIVRPHNIRTKILGVLGIAYFIVWDRLHVRPDQLIEMTIYPLLGLVFLWEVLRYTAQPGSAKWKSRGRGAVIGETWSSVEPIADSVI